jgi:N-acetylmuramoyl-L-alanine amidase
MELFIYLAKAAGCTAAFYMVYHVMFRKLTFFSLNRYYLLSALAVSLIIPLLQINITTTLPDADVHPVLINTVARTVQRVAEIDPSITVQQPVNWILVAAIAYCAIAGLLLLKLLVTTCNIVYRAIKYGERENGYRIISGRSENNSSFFRFLFLNKEGLDDEEQQQVIVHEMMHAKLFHSVDNLFTEVLKAVLWFNPFVYLFSKALHQAHEFEVDNHLTLQYNSKNYAGLLLKLSSPATAGLSNQFSAYGLKARIQMLFGRQSAAAKKLGYLLVVPVVAGLVYFLAVQRVYAIAHAKDSGKDFVLVLDAGHGGKSGARVGDIFESDIALAVVKQIKTIAEERGLKTILTRADNADVPLENRVGKQGDAFLSIHVNYQTGKQANGASGMVVMTDRLNSQPESQKLAVAFIDEMKKLNGITISDEVYHQGIKVLRENKAPAILLEIGYLTNKSDLKYMTDAQKQHDIAVRCVDAIMAYKNSSATK